MMKWLDYFKLQRLDRYIIKKFLGTYFFSLLLIIVVIIAANDAVEVAIPIIAARLWPPSCLLLDGTIISVPG